MPTVPPIDFFSWDEVPGYYATASQWPRRGKKVAKNQNPAARVLTTATFKKGEQFVSDDRVLADDGLVVTVVADQIPLYHEGQTRPYTARHRTLDYFGYEEIFFDYGRKDRFIYWQESPPDDPPKGWTPGWRKHPSLHGFDPNRRLRTSDIRSHLSHTRVYGGFAGAWTRYVLIDLDLHAGDRTVFLDQLRVLVGRFWGGGGWHLEVNPDQIGGVHLVRAFPERRRTANEISKLRRWLAKLDLSHQDLKRRAKSAGMKTLSGLEVYPQESGNGIRLPLGRGRTVLLDRPLGTVTHRGKSFPDLHGYLRWLHDPDRGYMAAADVMVYVTERLATVVPKPALVQLVKGQADTTHSGKVFGALKGRFRQVLVEFFTGKLAPKGSLNAGLLLGARALWLEGASEADAGYTLERYARELPDPNVSGRLVRGEFAEIDRVILSTLKTVYRGNGGQVGIALSSASLSRTAEAWRRSGFRFADKSTWANAEFVTQTPCPVTLDDATRQRIGETMALALKIDDLALAVEVAEYLLGVVAAKQPSGAGLAVTYFRKVIEQEFGIPCGAHGKTNEVIRVMCSLKLIRKVASHHFSAIKGRGSAAKYEVDCAYSGNPM